MLRWEGGRFGMFIQMAISGWVIGWLDGCIWMGGNLEVSVMMGGNEMGLGRISDDRKGHERLSR